MTDELDLGQYDDDDEYDGGGYGCGECDYDPHDECGLRDDDVRRFHRLKTRLRALDHLIDACDHTSYR